MVKNRKCCIPGIHTGPFLLNINTLDMFLEQKDVNFAAHTDDNAPYFL